MNQSSSEIQSRQKRVEIVLRCSKTLELFSFSLLAQENAIGSRWFNALWKIIQGENILEKNFTFQGFPNSARTMPVLIKELNFELNVLSEFRAPGAWENGYPIPHRSYSDKDLTREQLNLLHHDFEIFIGQVWNLSPFYLEAPLPIKLAIRRLNFLVHEIEALQKAEAHLKNGESLFPHSVFSFLFPNRKFEPLLDSDYEHFSFSTPFGSVVMNYSQSGKTHFEAWYDGDEEIFDDNINGLRYFNGEFVIIWGPYPKSGYSKTRITDLEKFNAWLKQKGADTKGKPFFVDANGVKQGLGFLVVANLDPKSFECLTVSEIQERLGRFSDVYKIILSDDESTLAQTYEYFAQSDEFLKRCLKFV